jgi:transposase
MKYVGMDVHTAYSRICVLDEDGEIVEEVKGKTNQKWLRSRFEGVERMRVILEAGGHSLWIGRLLETLGHEVIVANPRQVRLIAESTMKTDRIDAMLLAQLGRVDPRLLAPVHLRSEEMQMLRSRLKIRDAFVKARTAVVNMIRAMLRGLGYRVASCKPKYLPKKLAELEIRPEHRELIAVPVDELERLTERIEQYEKLLEEECKQLEVAENLREIDGVGLITALSFIAAIEQPGRFKNSRDVGAYFGLRPSVRRSALEGKKHPKGHGRITKQGDATMRWLLVQAAHGLMRSKTDSELKRWGLKLAEKHGRGFAAVAVARKLAVLMHRLWVSDRAYDPNWHEKTTNQAQKEEAA